MGKIIPDQSGSDSAKTDQPKLLKGGHKLKSFRLVDGAVGLNVYYKCEQDNPLLKNLDF